MIVKSLVSLFAAVLVAGCATHPKIDSSRVPTPRTVVIHDLPDILPSVRIGVLPTSWPGAYFSPFVDSFFAAGNVAPQRLPDYAAQADAAATSQILNSKTPVSAGTGAAMGAVGGLIGAVLQISAETTQKRAAEFPSSFRSALPEIDLRTDLLKQLRSDLEARGITVVMATETRDLAPRLRWPAKNAEGRKLITGPLRDSDPVDADLLIQVSAIASYAAPGPLNNFRRTVGIGLAMFNGRTREFLGWQAFPFNPEGRDFQYQTYDALLEDMNKAGPALRAALVSLVPDLVNVIAGNSGR